MPSSYKARRGVYRAYVTWRNRGYFIGHYNSIEEAELAEVRFKMGMLSDREQELLDIIQKNKLRRLPKVSKIR